MNSHLSWKDTMGDGFYHSNVTPFTYSGNQITCIWMTIYGHVLKWLLSRKANHTFMWKQLQNSAVYVSCDSRVLKLWTEAVEYSENFAIYFMWDGRLHVLFIWKLKKETANDRVKWNIQSIGLLSCIYIIIESNLSYTHQWCPISGLNWVAVGVLCQRIPIILSYNSQGYSLSILCACGIVSQHHCMSKIFAWYRHHNSIF